MIPQVTVGQYLALDSYVHRLDPRTKIAISLVYVVTLFLVKNFWGFLVMAGFTALAVVLGRVPARLVIRGLRPILFLLVFTIGLNLFLTPGDPLFRVGPATVTRQGLELGGLVAVRLLLLVATTSLLTLTTSPVALTDGLERYLKPFARLGVPAHELAMMMTIALRFIPTLLEETDKIMKAQMARGAEFATGNLLQRARSLVPVLVPLFVSSFRRADELAMAMEARGYRGGRGRTRMRQLRLGRGDWLAAAGTLGLILAVALTRGWLRLGW